MERKISWRSVIAAVLISVVIVLSVSGLFWAIDTLRVLRLYATPA